MANWKIKIVSKIANEIIVSSDDADKAVRAAEVEIESSLRRILGDDVDIKSNFSSFEETREDAHLELSS